MLGLVEFSEGSNLGTIFKGRLCRIDILTDSTGDRAAQVRRATLAESTRWQ